MQIQLLSGAAALWGTALAVATAYALGLYLKNQRDELAKGWRWLLAALRFGFVFVVCFLLFAPFVKVKRERVEKPLCFVLLDQSSSMPQDIDTLLLQENIQDFSQKIAKNFEAKVIGFGGANTNYSQAFEQVRRQSADNKNLVCVLFSDGNNNGGAEPIGAFRPMGSPLYALAVGDTAIHPDLFIEQTLVNSYAYKGNRFPLQVRVGQANASGAPTRLTLKREGKVLRDTAFSFHGKKEQNIHWNIDAPESGMFGYTLELATLENERNTRNNRHSFFVRVLENRRKILLIAHAPHPDLSCLRQSLQTQEKYEIDVVLAENLGDITRNQAKTEAYDLVILHGLPSTRYPLNHAQGLLDDKPFLYMLTASTNLSALAQSGIRLRLRANAWNESQAHFNPEFTLFNVSEAEKKLFESFPPLQSPFAVFDLPLGGNSLFTQRLMGVATQDPLLWIGPQTDRRTAVWCGTHLWKWRLANFHEQGNTEVFDALMDKCMQLLCLSKPEENLVLQCPALLQTTEPLKLRAQLYNASFEKIARADIRFKLVDQRTKAEYLFDFAPENDGYVLDAGFLPEGSYVYTAQAQSGAETYQNEGRLIITDPQLENPMQRANTTLLRNLATTYDGKFFYMGTDGNANPEAWGELAQELLSRKDLKPHFKTEESYVAPLHRRWLLTTLLCFLCFEYFARKRFGSL